MNRLLMFSYGANTNFDHMAIKCPGAIRLGKADLKDHEFKFRRHANIEPHHGKSATGVLWEISESHLERLDMYESYPIYYDRKVVSVAPHFYSLTENKAKILSKYQDQNERTVPAIIYYMLDTTSNMLPDREYFDICYEGYVESVMDLSVLTRALEGCTLFQKIDKKGVFV